MLILPPTHIPHLSSSTQLPVTFSKTQAVFLSLKICPKNLNKVETLWHDVQSLLYQLQLLSLPRELSDTFSGQTKPLSFPNQIVPTHTSRPSCRLSFLSEKPFLPCLLVTSYLPFLASCLRSPAHSRPGSPHQPGLPTVP